MILANTDLKELPKSCGECKELVCPPYSFLRCKLLNDSLKDIEYINTYAKRSKNCPLIQADAIYRELNKDTKKD